jgi:hypothetical protein
LTHDDRARTSGRPPAPLLPVIPNAPLNATVLAVAERAAELIPGSAAGG